MALTFPASFLVSQFQLQCASQFPYHTHPLPPASLWSQLPHHPDFPPSQTKCLLKFTFTSAPIWEREQYFSQCFHTKLPFQSLKPNGIPFYSSLQSHGDNTCKSVASAISSHRRGSVIINCTKGRNTTSGDQWRCRASKYNQLACGRIPQIRSLILPTLTTKRCLFISAGQCLELIKYEPNNLEDAHECNKNINNNKNINKSGTTEKIFGHNTVEWGAWVAQ